MATIYRVWDLQRSVPLAMKVLHYELAEDPSFMARFQREAHSLQMLVHPHIVPFYGLYRADDLTFLLERYIDGPSLDEVLHRRNGQPLPFVDALVFFKGLYTSLGYAHAQGIVHCDVKPGNVLIDQGGHVYLTDFGIARYMDSAAVTASAMGTPLYMAPEQIRGERLTPQTDIYALGVLMFELLTGQRPFRGDEGVPDGVGENVSDRVRYQQLYVPPPNPRAYNPAIPEALAQVILKAMAKDPGERYPTVQAMATDMAQAVAARFETLPNRVRLPEELSAREPEWSPPPAYPLPAAEENAAVYPANLPGDAVQGDAPGGQVAWNAPQDTLPGIPPAPRIAPPAAHPARSPVNRRLVLLLGALALLVLCGLAGAQLVRGFNRGVKLPLPLPSLGSSSTPGMPTATQANTRPSEKTSTSKPSATHANPSPTGGGLSSFPVTGEVLTTQRVGGSDQLVLVNLADGSQTVLPGVPNVSPAVSNAAQWSPDGQRLVYISEYGGRLHVVAMTMNGDEPYQLPAGESYKNVSSPAFLPDGKRVSFWASGGNGTYMVIADVTSGKELSKTALSSYRNMFTWNWSNNLIAFVLPGGNSYKVAVSQNAAGQARLVDTGGEGYAPAWSNDGQRLAFQSDLNRDPGIDDIWISKPDGSDLHAVTQTPGGAWSRAPTFSSDGKMIAFVSNRSGGNGNDYGELFVLDLSSGKVRQITNTGGYVYDWRPAWRP